MQAVCLMACFCVLPYESATVDRVDLVEVNHVHCHETARPICVQLIFWDWAPTKGRYQVIAWRLAKGADSLPVKDWRGRCWVATWTEGDTLRQVRADVYRETWTQADIEREERREFPKELRRGLLFERTRDPWRREP